MSMDPTSWIAREPAEKGDQTFAEWANGPGVGKWYVRSLYTAFVYMPSALFLAVLLAVIPVAGLVGGLFVGVWLGKGLMALGVPEEIAMAWTPLIVGTLAVLSGVFLMIRLRSRRRARRGPGAPLR